MPVSALSWMCLKHNSMYVENKVPLRAHCTLQVGQSRAGSRVDVTYS